MYKTLRNGKKLARVYANFQDNYFGLSLDQRINMKANFISLHKTWGANKLLNQLRLNPKNPMILQDDSMLDTLSSYELVTEPTRDELELIITNDFSPYSIAGYTYSLQNRYLYIEHNDVFYVYPEQGFDQLQDYLESEMVESLKYYTEELEELETALLN